MAIDNKYGKLNFEEPNTIGENEPVVVFRAADPWLPAVMEHYGVLCDQDGSPELHLKLIKKTQLSIEQWQEDHPELVREKPTSSNWDGRYRVDPER